MRSLGYNLAGLLHALDDFLDYAKMHPPVEILIEPLVQTYPTDVTVHYEFIARFTWQFPDRTAACDVLCGGYREDMPLSTRHENVNLSTIALQKHQRRLIAEGLPVPTVDSRFNCPESLTDRGAIHA